MPKDQTYRKNIRLKYYDYSQNGYYYVTICTYKNKPILSKIVARGLAPAIRRGYPAATERECSPADELIINPATRIWLSDMTDIGKIVEEKLLSITQRYPYVRIDKYIIMPTHIHVVFAFEHNAAEAPGSAGESPRQTAGASPRPTLIDVVRNFKSTSTICCNQKDQTPGRKIWQASFYDEIIRNEQAYHKIWQYIDENPAKWTEDKYYINV